MKQIKPNPNGWFAVAFSHDVAPGKAVPVTFFDEDYVLWRGEESGKISILEAFCPHLGAHLAGGTVSGDRLACPFHGWVFDTDGVLKEVPYESTCPRFQQRGLPLVEQNGVILAWHHEAGEAPSWSMQIFDIEGWSEPTTRQWTFRSHPQDICENGMDVAHLKFVHGSEGRALSRAAPASAQVLRIEISLPTDLDPENPSDDRLINEVHGPGLVLAHLQSTVAKGLFRLYSTPVGDGMVTLRGIVTIKATEGIEDAAALNDFMAASVIDQWEQDRPIWENKIIRERPMLTRSEVAVGIYRQWYSQFYEAVAA